MGIYAVLVTGNNLSELVQQLTAQDEAIRTLDRGTVESGVKPVGLLQNKSDYGWSAGAGDAIRYWNGSAWSLVMDPRKAHINDAGTVPMAANLVMSGNRITGVADPIADGDAVTLAYFEAHLADAWGEDHDAGGFIITNLGSPFGQTSDAVSARYDDTWQTTHGLFRYVDAAVFDTVHGSGVTTGNTVDGGKRTDPSAAVKFCPRHIHFKFSGALTPIGGGASAGTLPVTHLDAYRDSSNPDVWGQIGSNITVGAVTFAVEIYFVTTPGGSRGFAVRMRRLINDSLWESAVAHAWCSSGVGMA